MMRRRTLLASIAVALLAAGPAAAQLHPNLERGFSSEKAFQVGEVDHVNLFNGNVSLTVPLGRSFPISEDLSLSLVASYNSKLWDTTKIEAPFSDQATTRLHPTRFANAGFGWLVSLGRLISPTEDVNETSSWLYQGPDGAVHEFRSKLHSTDPAAVAGLYYTTDNSYLRLRLDGSRYLVEFPGGVTQEFHSWGDPADGRWRLVKTFDRYGNFYQIDYSVANQWKITDSHDRTTLVTFEATPVSVNRSYEHESLAVAVKSVTLPPVDGNTATYEFGYVARDVRRGYCGEFERELDDDYAAVPVLTSITLKHGTTVVETWEAAYDFSLVEPNPGTTTESCKAGTILSLKLPTQATVRWGYGIYHLPGNCKSELAYDRSPGVVSRLYEASNGAEFTGDADGTWTYSPALTPATGSYFCGGQTIHGAMPESEMTNTVTSPAGDQTVHYFSVWPSGLTASNGAAKKEFGLPFSRWNVATPLISTKACQGSCASAANVRRTTYLNYERDFGSAEEFDANRRVVWSKTVHHDDQGNELDSVETAYSGFDGVGHYRTATTSGNFGDGVETRTVTKNYNVRDFAVSGSGSVVNTGTYNSSDGTGFTLPGRWVLDTYSSIVATAGAVTSRQYTCFDPFTGALRASRILAGTSVQSKDLLTVYERNAAGFVKAERSYGGDATPLEPTTKTALCDFVDATVATDKPRPLGHHLEHTYLFGTRATTTPMKLDGTAMPFKTLDLVLDSSGLPTTVKDTAGKETGYHYDASGRITSITPSGIAPITYKYTSATATARARVATTQTSGGDTTKRELQFDSFGRPVVERRTFDTLILRSRTTTYDGAGRKTKVTEWGTTSGTTFTGFDFAGRPGTITAPDATTTELAYRGAREVSRTRRYQSPGGEKATTTTESYDPFGRLVSVEEAAGTTTHAAHEGGSVTASYTYDVADRLRTVSITPAGGTAQEREFTYDGRGLLTSEKHPEIDGLVSYTYDSQGRTVSKTIAGTSAFDLAYEYDPAGRMIKLFAGSPSRLTKEFVFGTAAGNGLGRLQSAKRYNYIPQSSGYYLVSEGYTYDDHGRVFERVTTIDKVTGTTTTPVRSFSQKQTYTDLGLPSTLTYPQCVNCNSPVRDQQFTYNLGLLKTIPGFVEDFDYGMNGAITQIDRENGTADVITPSPHGLQRPAAIKFIATCTPPVVTPEPADQTVERGTNATLIAGATGTSPQYQWAERLATSTQWNDIPGATGPTLTRLVSADTYFRLTVSNGCGSDPSREAKVTVADAPSISVQPVSHDVERGDPATLSVVAQGTAPLEYRWYRGTAGDTNDPVAGTAGAGSVLSLSAVVDTTTYWVRVTNAWGSADSQDATITAYDLPEIQIQPPSKTIAGGQSTSLPISAAGTGTLSFQWFRGLSGDMDDPIAPAAGIQPNYLTGSLWATTSYWVRVSNAYGHADSVTATVTVILPAPSSMIVTPHSPTQIRVAWTESQGAAKYRVERRSGSGFVTAATVTANEYIETVPAGTARAYRVVALDANGTSDSAPTAPEFASTFVFPAVQAALPVQFEDLNAILAGVNALRAAAGAASLTWSNLVTAPEPVPADGVSIKAAHVEALRTQANAARAALGSPPRTFPDALAGAEMKAIHITELQEALR